MSHLQAIPMECSEKDNCGCHKFTPKEQGGKECECGHQVWRHAHVLPHPAPQDPTILRGARDRRLNKRDGTKLASKGDMTRLADAMGASNSSIKAVKSKDGTTASTTNNPNTLTTPSSLGCNSTSFSLSSKSSASSSERKDHEDSSRGPSLNTLPRNYVNSLYRNNGNGGTSAAAMVDEVEVDEVECMADKRALCLNLITQFGENDSFPNAGSPRIRAIVAHFDIYGPVLSQIAKLFHQKNDRTYNETSILKRGILLIKRPAQGVTSTIKYVKVAEVRDNTTTLSHHLADLQGRGHSSKKGLGYKLRYIIITAQV